MGFILQTFWNAHCPLNMLEILSLIVAAVYILELNWQQKIR